MRFAFVNVIRYMVNLFGTSRVMAKANVVMHSKLNRARKDYTKVSLFLFLTLHQHNQRLTLSSLGRSHRNWKSKMLVPRSDTRQYWNEWRRNTQGSYKLR